MISNGPSRSFTQESVESWFIKLSDLDWEKEFTDLNPKKNSKGTRRYSSVDIEKLQIIHHLVKEKGYTLEGAKEQLKTLDKNFEIIKKLEKIKSTLINIKKEL